ncbi:MAG: hypothetical protein ACREDO_08175 [Methyloceanibacter sp.]
MASVSVVWRGNSRDPQIRYRLLGRLHRLAALSDEYLRLRQPERPAILNLLGAQRQQGIRPRANVETIDRQISGQILISSWIGPQPEILVERARQAGLRVIDPEEEGPHLVFIENARLRGLDFKLFDPRGLYPGSDRMSFVFLECPEHHFLDGRLVEIAVGEDKEFTTAQSLAPGSIYLSMPSIHLRYYLEDWTDCLFSWIRFFFIGDFWWQRWEEFQGYADYRSVFEQIQTERGGAEAEEATFEAVLGTFSQHAEHWIGEVRSCAKG